MTTPFPEDPASVPESSVSGPEFSAPVTPLPAFGETSASSDFGELSRAVQPPSQAVQAAAPEDFLWVHGSAEAAAITAAESGLVLPRPVEEAPPRPRRRWRRTARELVETLILALLIFLVVRSAVQNFRVEGSSMLPSLADGQYLIINKAIYTHINLRPLERVLPFLDFGDDPEWYIFRKPRRGDVVVFRFPNDPNRDFIKRIIGEPGDTVEVRGSVVYINGQPLDESYLENPPTYTYGPATVPPKQYFVLGDNRNNSYDSHVWGFVPRENIIGQAWLSYWPTDSFGLVPNKNLELKATEENPLPAAEP